jgi:hypothetical protein
MRSSVFLLACRTSTHDSTGLTPANLVGRERLPCGLLLGYPVKEWATANHAANLVDHLHETYNYARLHLKLASDRMRTRYNGLANFMSHQEGHKVWLCRSTRMKGSRLRSIPHGSAHTR